MNLSVFSLMKIGHIFNDFLCLFVYFSFWFYRVSFHLIVQNLPLSYIVPSAKVNIKYKMEESKCMPTPPDRVGREFVRQYFTIMNKSPENLHCFYTNEASFLHDDIDPYERRTILAEGKMAIRDAMVERSAHIQHTSTKIHLVDTNETLDNGILVQINGEISFNEQPMRPFSQTFILVPKSPFQYFVQNDMFRFTDFEFERLVLQHHSISIQTDSTEEDWGTQCEEYIEPYDEQVKQTRVNAAHGETDRTELENEVKLDTSDSGLSSDAEKAIMDIQSLNLKSILQEPRSLTKEAVMKRGPTPPSVIEGESTSNANVIPSANDMSEHCEKLFRDSCILTIGNVINPNIEFDDADHNENDKATETVDLESEMRSDDTGKAKYRKKKDKRKAKMEMAKEKVLDESTEDEKPEKLPTENVTEIEPKITDDDTSTPKSVPMEKTDKPSISASVIKKLDPSPVKKLQPSPTPKKVSFELDTPKVIPEIKTYADLAKTGKNEWVDELPAQRESAERNQAKPSSVRPPLVRRHSRTEKSTPPSGK